MPEGLSPIEVGKQVSEHAEHEVSERRDRWVSIAEAALLSAVTLLAAWSGYAAARWSTESRLALAEASAMRTEADQADLDSRETANFDAETFDAWFTAYTASNAEAMDLAVRRMRPEYRTAFEAWRATDPETDPAAPASPMEMPEYARPGEEEAARLAAAADDAYAEGQHNGDDADRYVRTTVLFASVLFLVGISSHFPVRGGRYALIGVGVVVLLAALVQLATLPWPAT